MNADAGGGNGEAADKHQNKTEFHGGIIAQDQANDGREYAQSPKDVVRDGDGFQLERIIGVDLRIGAGVGEDVGHVVLAIGITRGFGEAYVSSGRRACP